VHLQLSLMLHSVRLLRAFLANIRLGRSRLSEGKSLTHFPVWRGRRKLTALKVRNSTIKLFAVVINIVAM
jgi:hypothetical protein